MFHYYMTLPNCTKSDDIIRLSGPIDSVMDIISIEVGESRPTDNTKK